MNLLFFFKDIGFKCLLKGAYKAREALFISSSGIMNTSLKMRVFFFDEGER